MYCLKNILVIFFALLMRSSLGLELMVNDSLILNSLIPTLLGETKEGLIQTKSLFDVNRTYYSGFLIVISNRMRVDSDSCKLFEEVLSFKLNDHPVTLSCSRYIIRYEPAPLWITIAPIIFANISHLIEVIITAVRLSCPILHADLRQCPSHPNFCISKRLFCDSVDNCGMNADELDCPIEFPLVGLQTFHTFNEDGSYPNAKYLLRTHGYILLLVCLLLIFILLALTAIFWMSNQKLRIRTAEQQQTPICPKIEITSENEEIDLPCRKKQSVVQKFISSFKSRKTSEVINEAEESIALLSLGLKNVLYTLPIEKFGNEDEDGEIPARVEIRSSNYSSSSSSDSLFLFKDDE